jgi:hypothetical protein
VEGCEVKRIIRAFQKRVIRLSNLVYERQTTGAYIRINPLRPWRGKSERRAVIKARRIAKQEAA